MSAGAEVTLRQQSPAREGSRDCLGDNTEVNGATTEPDYAPVVQQVSHQAPAPPTPSPASLSPTSEGR